MTTIPGHVAGAFLAIELVSFIDPSLGLDKNSVLAFGALIGVFPDIDALFYINNMQEHHNTPLHTPFFWLLLFLGLSFFYSSPYLWAAAIAVFSHILLDWYSARISGIRIFYPFSNKHYSAFPLGLADSLFTREYSQLYIGNKILLFSEITIVLGAVAILVYKLVGSA